MWHWVIFLLDTNPTLTTFLEAELGFFGEAIKTFKQVAFFGAIFLKLAF